MHPSSLFSAPRHTFNFPPRGRIPPNGDLLFAQASVPRHPNCPPLCQTILNRPNEFLTSRWLLPRQMHRWRKGGKPRNRRNTCLPGQRTDPEGHRQLPGHQTLRPHHPAYSGTASDDSASISANKSPSPSVARSSLSGRRSYSAVAARYGVVAGKPPDIA